MTLPGKTKLIAALLFATTWGQAAAAFEMECNRANLGKQMAENAELINGYIENSDNEREAHQQMRSLTKAYGESDRYIDTSDEAGKLMADANRQPSQLMCDQMEEVHEIFESYIKRQQSIADIKRKLNNSP